MLSQKKAISKARKLPFSPDERQCLILGNFNYEKLRYMGTDKDGNPKQLGYADLHHVEPDLRLFR